MSATTHTLPLHLLARYLITQLHCQVYFIGIQPHDTGFDLPLSPPVQVAVEAVAQELLVWGKEGRMVIG
ncbi:MAG: hypothetical protein V9G20_12400 [Candidatus Promineifilaceae bacterium]